MSAAASSSADTDRGVTLIEFGQARARLLKTLRLLDDEIVIFCRDAGERASLDIIRQLLPEAVERIEATKGRPIDRQVCRDLLRALASLAPAFDTTVAEDIEAEARESENANPLRARFFAASDTYDRLVAFAESLGDSIDDGEQDMSDAPFPPATATAAAGWPAPQAPGRAGVRYLSVADQMVATLNELGLPHDGGSLSTEGKRVQIAESLIRALNNGFDVSNSSIGMRAQRKIQPGWTAASASRGLLAGRLEIDAEAIRVEADGLEMLLDGVQDRFRYQLSDRPDATDRTRIAIRELLREIREIVGRPTGVPVAQAEARITQLAKRVGEYFQSFEATIAIVEFDVNGRTIDAIVLHEDSDLVPTPATRSERFRAQYLEALRHVASITVRIKAAIKKRSAGELAFRIERAMEAAARAIVDVRLRLQSSIMTGAIDRWQAVDLPEIKDSGDKPENLADGLEGALAWLQPHADRFARPSFFADDLTDDEAADLGRELLVIADIFDSSVAALLRRSEDAQFTALVAGLAQVTRKAGELATEISHF